MPAVCSQKTAQYADPQAAPAANLALEPMGYADGIELFAAGKHHEGTPEEREWTPEELQQAAKNYELLSTGENPLIRVPFVLGHEDDPDQIILQNTGLPAAGWLKPEKGAVWAENGKLKGNGHEFPKPIADALNRHAYRKVSAELYDDFVHEGVHYGPTLKRIAILGATQPEVKTLADFPTVRFADWQKTISFADGQKTVTVRHTLPNPLHIFSEAKGSPPMDRAQMLDALSQLGYPVETITDAVSDEQVASIFKLCSGHDTTTPQDTTPPAPGPDGQFADPTDPTGMDSVTQNMDNDQDGQGDPLVGKHADSQEPLNAPGVASDTRTVPPADAVAPAAAKVPTSDQLTPGHVMPMSAQQPKQVTMKFSEMTQADFDRAVAARVQAVLNSQLKPLAAKQSAIEAQINKRLANEKRLSIQTFGEAMIKEGRVSRAEWYGNIEQKIPGLQHVLMSLSASKVSKFAEQSVSQLDLVMESIRHRPKVVQFAEQIQDPTGSRGRMSPERKAQLLGKGEVGKVALTRQK